MSVLIVAVYVVFAIAGVLTLWRIIVGPSILDRAVASDVLLTLVMCALGADMVINHHTRSLPALLIIAAVGVLRLHRRGALRRTEGQHRPMNDILDIAALVLVLIGGLLCITAAIGLLRFRDVPTRLHAATKPQVLGLILICLAIALSLRSWPVVAFLVPVVMMQLATAPLSAHMVGRQAYRNGTIDERSLYVDELDEARRTPPAAGG